MVMNSQIRRDRLCSAQQCRGAAQNVPSSQNQPRTHSQVCKLCFFPFQELIWELVNWTDFADMILWKCQYEAIKMNFVNLNWFVCYAFVPTNMKYHNNIYEQVAARPVPSCWTVQLSPSIVHPPTFYHFFSAFDVTLFALSNFSFFLGYNWQQ